MSEERELSWDDLIASDGPDFVTLPEGEYHFEVTSFERGRYSPKEGAKLPPCNMATLNIKIEDPRGTTNLKHNLYLHTTTEGLLCAFFTSIGLRRKGEPVTMNWGAVPGARGRAKVGVRKYTGKDGEEHTVNEIKKFMEPVDAPKPAPPPRPAGFEPGRF